MKLIVNRIVTEFNKIFNGTKRVGDSLRLEGKRMNALDVANASTLGYKTESALSVSKSVVSEKTATLQSFSTNGNAVVDSNGNAVYLKENQLSVNNSQLLKGVEPANLEVDISRRLKVGSEPTSPVINVSNLIVDVVACRVKDSGLLGGKTESQLFVANAVNANNSNLLSNKSESTLSVERSRVSTRLISDVDGLEMRESQLRAYSTQTIKRGSENLDIYALRDYLFSTDQAKTIIVSTATSAQRLTAVGGDKTFADIITHIKNDSSVEAYKSTRLVTGSGATSTARTGDEYKNWFLEHVDFSNKIATLNANTSNRALRFGDATTNYSVAEMDVRIKTTVVDTAANSNKLQNYTAEELISLTRSRVLTDASNGQTGLTQLEVDGFFGNNRVKIALLGTKVTNSGNADTLGTKTLATIKQEIKDEGQVLTAKYLYSDPSMGGQKSYIDITSDILRAKNDVLDGATTEYNTLKKIENIVKSNKSTIETSLSSETSNRNIAVNLLQTNINTEKSRVDAILLGADTDKNSFAEIKTYIDGLTGSLSLSTTALGNGVVRNVINITNALETRLVSYESSSTSTTTGLSGAVDRIAVAVGLASNGNLSPISGKHYVTGASSVLNAVYALDAALKVEETTRNNKDVEAKTYADNIKIAVDGEITRAKAVEGTLNLLTSNSKMNLVSAINSVVADLTTEISERSTNNTTLSDKINATNTDLASEVSRAKSIEGTLTSLTTTNKTNLVDAINESITKIKSEETRALGVESTISSNLSNEINRAKTIEGALTSLTTTNKTNLVDAINESITKIKSEETRASAVEGSLTSLTTTNKTNLVSAINELRTSITTETNSRVTAISNSENSLSTQINSEKTRINKIVEGLGFSNIDTLGTISFNETTYLNSKTKIKDALVTLDESLRSVNSIQTNRMDVIVAQINAAVGLNGGITNYSNVINANSNYIKTATSMLDADNKLDAQIKVNTDAILKINADSSVNGSFAKGDLESLTSSKAYTDIRETNITTAYKNYADIETQRAKTIEGTLTSLTTTNKTNLVNAINELNTGIVGISTIYGSNGIINYESGTQIEIKQNVLTPTLRVSKSIELKDASQGYHKIDVVTSTVNQQDIHDLTYDGSRIVTDSNMQNAILKSGGVLTTDISRIHNVLGTSSSDTSYKSESTANYISSATNFKDADNKLDAQLKIVTDKANNSLSKTNNLSDLSDMVIARNNLDVYSTSQVENAINIAKLSLGTNYSTDNVASRDTLVDLTVGDNIFVLNDGDGKWAIYRTVKESPNPTFQKIMDQDVFLENFNALQKTKLDGIESGAQVNTVYSVANKKGDVTLEKSDVGLGDVENIKLSTWVGSNNINTVGTITLGTWDATPISNVTQNAVKAHQNALLITKSQITDFDVLDYELAIKVKNTAFNKNFGIATDTVAMGNDSRIINGQTAFNWGNHAAAGYQQSSNAVTKNMTFGGHVSGTYNNIVITDNSHNHTTANISDWESSLDTYVDNKVTTNTIYNTSNFGKTEIDALNINASTVNGKTVKENVPAGAVFTDTKYKLDTIYYDEVILNATNFNSNGDIVLEYEITKGGVSVVDDITKNIRVYIGGRKLRNTKFNIINTPNERNMLVIESDMKVAGFSEDDAVEIERMVLTTI